MNSRTQTDIWIDRVAIVLGLIIVASILGVIVLAMITTPGMEFFGMLAVVSLAGLGRLFASPLN